MKQKIRHCPFCGSNQLKSSKKHGVNRAPFEIGWDEEKEECLTEGEAEIFRCKDCKMQFLVSET